MSWVIFGIPMLNIKETAHAVKIHVVVIEVLEITNCRKDKIYHKETSEKDAVK